MSAPTNADAFGTNAAGRFCQAPSCLKSLEGRRKHAQTCSVRCRQRLSRALNPRPTRKCDIEGSRKPLSKGHVNGFNYPSRAPEKAVLAETGQPDGQAATDRDAWEWACLACGHREYEREPDHTPPTYREAAHRVDVLAVPERVED